MKRLELLILLLTTSFMVLASCAAPASVPVSSTNAPVSSGNQPSSTLPASGAAYAPVIDPANFVKKVDNPYFPLKPGTTFVYEGKTEKGNEHNDVAVTSATKDILGVTCVVVSDTVKVDGLLEERTIDWYAQDKQGNVWYFGEDAKDYDPSGKMISTQGSWQAGVKGAQPGIVMEANPKVGDTYRQEYYKGEAEDMASVTSVTETATVKYGGSYTNLLTTKEWSVLDPTVVEKKYYAKDVGFILVTIPNVEKLDLIDVLTK